MGCRFDRGFDRATIKEEGFCGMIGPGLDCHSFSPLKLHAKGIPFDEEPENGELFKQGAEAHAGLVRFYPALYRRTSAQLYRTLPDAELCAGGIS